MKNWILVLLVFLSFAAATPPVGVPPSEDSFYIPPEGFESASPGDILKSREIPSPLRGVVAHLNIAGTWQLMVRSEDSLGNATAIVTTVLKPYNADPSKILSYQFVEVSSDLDCSPSWSMQFSAPIITNFIGEAEFLFVQSYLAQGWYVVAPDYEGLLSAFCVGRTAGKATLDSLRGALKSTNLTGIDKDAKAIFFGYSGGSIPSSWAAALQPKYAPELLPQLLGAAIGGLVTNITAIAKGADGGLFSGVVPVGIAGMFHEYSQHLDIVKAGMVSEEAYNRFMWAGQTCIVEVFFNFIGRGTFTGSDRLFTDGWDFLNIPVIQELVLWNTLAVIENEVPDIPIYVFHAKHDELAPVGEAVRAYNNWCAWGIKSFEFNLDDLTEHVLQAVTGSQAAFTWMKNLFDGGKAVDGCKFTERYLNAEIPGFFGALEEQLSAAYDSVLGDPIGPANSTNSKRDSSDSFY